MTRIDWVILLRLGTRMLLTVVIVLGLIAMVESLDTWRFNYLVQIGGIPLALLGIFASASNWLIRALPVVVLLGAVIGIIDLQSRRELTAIKASGASIWRIMRAPALLLLVAGALVSLGFEDAVITINRSLEATLPGSNFGASNGLWLEQDAGGQHYIVHAEHVVANGRELQDAQFFLPDGLGQGRIVAPSAKLQGTTWFMPVATRYLAGAAPQKLTDFSVPTVTSPVDLRLKLTTTDDMTFYELAGSMMMHVSDPDLRNAVTTRFLRLLALPVALVGALFIAFAFTASYRRSNRYGASIVYAVLAGFVVFALTEMADRAGSAGVINPTFAALGPAFVALVIGVTVLLYTEDGWT